MAAKLITAASAYPVTAAEVKAHCRIDGNVEDSLVDAYIAAATSFVEEYLGRSLMAQTWEVYFDGFANELLLPRGPVQSVSSVKYYDLDNALQTADTALYVTDLVSDPQRVVKVSDATWPDTFDGINTVIIRYVAGYETIPAPIKHAIKLLVGDFYLVREDTLVERSVTPASMPNGVAALLANYRAF